MSVVVPQPPPWRTRLLLLCVALLFVTAFQGSRGLWEPDEGRYTAVALNMLNSGDWLTPRLNADHPHFTKPPMTYWAIGASLGLLGRNQWAARMPNALAFLATIVLAWLLARRLAPRRPLAAPLVYGTMLLPFAAASVVTTDTLLTCFEALAVYGFVSAWWGGPARRRRWLLLMWTGFGLAFLTKGPPGLLPLLPILLFTALVEGAGPVRRLVTLPGLIAFLMLGLGWYVAVILKHASLIDYFIKDEVVGRIFTGMHHRNAQWYGWLAVYGPALLLGALPWSWVLLRRPRAQWRRLGQWRRAAFRRHHPEELFLWLWLVVPLIIFCLSRSRLVLYVAPLFMPLALLVVRRLPLRWRLGWRAGVALGAWVALLVGVKGAARVVGHERNDQIFAQSIRKQVAGPIKGLVFIDDKPYFGLSFYLGCEVKRVALEAPDEPKPAVSRLVHELDLAQELARPRPDRLFLLRKEAVDDLRRLTERLGWRATSVGRYDRFRLYRLRRAGGAAPADGSLSSTP